MAENYMVRDMRTRFAWCDSNALRTLFEDFTGVEKRNLITLYMAFVLKVSYSNFQSEFCVTNKDICDFTGLSKDNISGLMRTLEEKGLIHEEIARDAKGFVVGKEIILLNFKKKTTDSRNTGTSKFLSLNNYTTYNKSSILSKDNINKNNKVSKDTEEISIEITETPSANNSRGNKPRIDYDIYEEFADIINYAADNKILSRPTVTQEGDYYIVPKYLNYAIQKLICLKTGRFISDYKIKTKNLDESNWRAEVYKALDNLKIMKEDKRVWPVDKNTLPKDLNTFLYNDRTNFSFFIKCLEEVTTQKEDRVNEKYGDIVKEEHIKPFSKWFASAFYQPTYEGEVNLVRNLGELITVQGKLWEVYGKYYTKIGNWSQWLGGSNPNKFLDFYLEFLKKKKFSPHEGQLRPNSNAFVAFTRYLRSEYDINILMSPEEHADLIERATPKKKTTIVDTGALDDDFLGAGVLTAEDLQKGVK